MGIYLQEHSGLVLVIYLLLFFSIPIIFLIIHFIKKNR